jgi:hypothetical protein
MTSSSFATTAGALNRWKDNNQVRRKLDLPSTALTLGALGPTRFWPRALRGSSLRYEKTETVLRIALDMQGSAQGISLEDIRTRYSDKPLSRRTAERLRDAVERVFPQMEQANPGETPKRWRIRFGTVNGLLGLSADELAALGTATSLLKRESAHAWTLLRSAESAQM